MYKTQVYKITFLPQLPLFWHFGRKARRKILRKPAQKKIRTLCKECRGARRRNIVAGQIRAQFVSRPCQ